MTTSGYQLSLADSSSALLLDLMENDNGSYRLDVLGQDATFGNPVPASEVVSSLMGDGGLSVIRSFGNRTAVFLVTVTAQDAGGLADGEAELLRALDRAAALVWHVPFGSPSYFDVVAAWSEHVFDDLTEVRQVQRQFRLSLECLPFARSSDLTTVTWTGGATELDPLTSISGGSGWTTVSGSASISGGIQTGTSWTGRKTFTVDRYLWFKVQYGSDPGGSLLIGTVKVGGVAVPNAELRSEGAAGAGRRFYTVPVPESAQGKSVAVEFTLTSFGGSSTLTELWTRSYPGPVVDLTDTSPRGIGVMAVGGTARTPCTISFTAPAGGAFVYTGPDPNAAIRDRGAAEVVYGKFTVSDADGAELSVGGRLTWWPPGDHCASIGVTSPQPLQLSPHGVWPSEASGEALFATGVAAGASQFAYPVDAKAAVSFFSTSGAKTLISPSPSLPQGYHGDAVTHEQHTLHPGDCGIAVLDVNGDPITATITYYRRYKHHVAD